MNPLKNRRQLKRLQTVTAGRNGRSQFTERKHLADQLLVPVSVIVFRASH
jgi:hypothetical protein